MELMRQERPIGREQACPVLTGRAEAVRTGLASRRDFLKATGTAMMASLLPGSALPAQAVPASAPWRPNVVLILAGDATKIKTPNLDRMAGEGIVFLEAETFSERGGWVLDQQFMDQMGSPFLLANGLGTPVADAKTSIEFPAKATSPVSAAGSC